MDKADRASNRLEVRHRRIPPRMYERVHKNASASRQTRPPSSTAPAPDLPRTRGPDASGPSHPRNRRFRSKSAFPLTRSRLSRASLHASAGYPRAGAPRRPRRRARRFPRRRARAGERQGGRARDGQPGGPARAVRGGEDRTRFFADDGTEAVRRRRRRVRRVGRIELGEPRIALGALGRRDARGAEKSRAAADGREQMGRSAKRERRGVDAKERRARVVWDGSLRRRRRRNSRITF